MTLQASIPGARSMAERQANAIKRGIETLAQLGDIPDDQAVIAWRVLVHIGMARADAVTGQPEWRHGWFLEREQIMRAVEQSGELLSLKASPWRKRGRR